MNVMAALDGSQFAEAILPILEKMARLPGATFTLVGVASVPSGLRQRRSARRPTAVVANAAGGGTAIVIQAPPAAIAETKSQAIQRTIAEMADYLRSVAERLPAGPTYLAEAHVADEPAATIIERARAECPDVIVMATHAKTGVVRTLFGSTAEDVVRSGVAPVLLVHPET